VHQLCKIVRSWSLKLRLSSRRIAVTILISITWYRGKSGEKEKRHEVQIMKGTKVHLFLFKKNSYNHQHYWRGKTNTHTTTHQKLRRALLQIYKKLENLWWNFLRRLDRNNLLLHVMQWCRISILYLYFTNIYPQTWERLKYQQAYKTDKINIASNWYSISKKMSFIWDNLITLCE